MNISVDQAIEIYAKVLCAWRGVEAPADAESKARERRLYGDEEGYLVWSRVSKAAAVRLGRAAAVDASPSVANGSST